MVNEYLAQCNVVLGFDDGHFFHAMRWRCFFSPHYAMRCDIDYFWRYPTIAIGAIIFPNNRDRLFCEVFLILRFLEFLRGFGDFWCFLMGF